MRLELTPFPRLRIATSDYDSLREAGFEIVASHDLRLSASPAAAFLLVRGDRADSVPRPKSAAHFGTLTLRPRGRVRAFNESLVPRRVRQRRNSRFNPSPLSSLRLRTGSFGIVPGVQQIPVRSTNCNSGRLHPASFSPRSGRGTCPITVLPRQRRATSHPSRAGPAPGALAPLEPAPSLSTLDRSSWFPRQGRQLEMKVTSAKPARPAPAARPA